MYLVANAQYHGFYKDDEEEAFRLLDEAINLFPEVPYPRLLCLILLSGLIELIEWRK